MRATREVGAAAVRGDAPAGARVRAADEHEARGEHEARALTRDADHALLERLAERVERDRRELAELVEEQDAAVGEGDLPGTGPDGAAADERGRARGVVRGAERAGDGEAIGRPATGDGGDAGDLDGFVGVERGQDRGESAGEHRLAAAGRTGEEQVVGAGGRDLEREPGGGEASTSARSTGSASVGSSVSAGLAPAGSGSGQGSSRLETGAQGREVRGAAHVETGDERGLEVVLRRDDHRPDAAAGERVGQDERAGHGPDGAVEAELAEHAHAVEAPRGELVLTEGEGQGDRELEAGAGLAHGGGERFTVIRLLGHAIADDCIAARARSRDSRPAVSGRPTTV